MDKFDREKFLELKAITNIIAFKVAIPLYLLFWLLDIIYVPQFKWEFLGIRLMIIPAAIITYLWLRKAQTFRSAERAALFFVFVCGLILNIMIYVIGKGALYNINLQLVAIGSLSFIPWSAPYFLFTIVAIYGPYLAIESRYLSNPDYIAQFAVTGFFISGVITITWILGSFRKQMHEKEIHIRQNLMQQIKRRKRTELELVIALDQAQEATRAKEMFLANMSHEIRTPLTAIIGFADSALDEDQTKQQRIYALQTIHQSGHHLLQIITDILDFSKIEAGALQIEKLSVNTIQLASEIDYMIKDQALQKGLEFKIEYVFPVPETFTSDPVRIKQILLNFCSNAIKFTDQGSVILTVKYQQANKKLTFSVADTGIGMSDKQINNLFKPFIQADNSIARRFGGTGLGLSLSKQLAEILDGDITVTSNVNEGSVFEYSFYIDKPADTLISSTNDISLSSVSHHRQTPYLKLSGNILLVEDNELNQILIKSYLEKMGTTVTTADNGEVAVRLAQQHNFDLIFMDMQMPVMPGIDAVHEIRTNGITTPIIMLTANVTKQDKQKCLDSGASDFMTKPVIRQALYEMTKTYLTVDHQSMSYQDSTLSTLFDEQPDTQDKANEYFETLITHQQQVNQHFRNTELEQVKTSLKNLKETANRLGYPTLSEFINTIELSGIDIDIKPESEQLDELNRQLDSIYLGLSQIMLKKTRAA
ncbi:MAG: response regulator [Gammaproteobacteria bacterium]|nr:response regulator [Gammaproteobacteria bacterium]